MALQAHGELWRVFTSLAVTKPTYQPLNLYIQLAGSPRSITTRGYEGIMYFCSKGTLCMIQAEILLLLLPHNNCYYFCLAWSSTGGSSYPHDSLPRQAFGISCSTILILTWPGMLPYHLPLFNAPRMRTSSLLGTLISVSILCLPMNLYAANSILTLLPFS